MSMLSEKRKEVAEKLERLMREREESIKSRLDAYREQLENEPLSDEIINTQTVLNAIDDVIKYENEALSKIEIVENLATKEEKPAEEIKEEKIEIPAEEVKEEKIVEEVKEEEIPAEPKIEEVVEIIEEAPATEEVKEEAVEEIVESAPVEEESKEEIIEEVKEVEKVEEVTEESAEIEVKVNENGEVTTKLEPIEARPGMAYIGVPERR